MQQDIVLYVDARDRSQIADFLDDVRSEADAGRKDAVRLKKHLDLHFELLKQYGTRIGEPYVDYLGDDIWELRPGSNRILFFVWKGGKLVLLHQFRKTTRKTPRREIERAIQEAVDWQARHG